MTLSQWSKGEYTGATNHEDDLDIIGSKLGTISDVVGDSRATATGISASGNKFSVKGVIEHTGDIDVYQVNLGSGDITITAQPYYSDESLTGGDLDLKLSLYDFTGALQAEANALNLTFAQLTGTINRAGTYFLVVEPVGSGDPMATPPRGATSYGSIGQYILYSGTDGTATTGGGTTSGSSTGGGGTVIPVTDPGTGGGTTSGTPSYSAPQEGNSNGCGIGGGALALIASGALALWTASRRR
jgi:hypothetical protein